MVAVSGNGKLSIFYYKSYNELGIYLQCRRPQFDSWVRKICWRRDRLPTPIFLGFPCGSAGKESACNAGGLDSIPGLGRYPGEGQGGLENSMDCIVHGDTKIRTRLNDFHFHYKSCIKKSVFS